MSDYNVLKMHFPLHQYTSYTVEVNFVWNRPSLQQTQMKEGYQQEGITIDKVIEIRTTVKLLQNNFEAFMITI